MNADSMTAQNGRGARKLGAAKIWLTGLAGLLLILVGISVSSFVEMSSLQASLSHAQQQIGSEKSELSAEQQQVGEDEQKLSTLQSTVDSQLVNGLSSFAKYGYVCSTSNVQFGSQQVTAYYPCTNKNPN